LKAELSAEDLEAEPQTGTNSVIDTVWAREMADQRVEEAIPQLGEKKERLKSQSLALASMATQMVCALLLETEVVDRSNVKIT
jgi:hypothetical protein